MSEKIQWSEPFRLAVGDKKPAVYQLLIRGEWEDGVSPGGDVGGFDAIPEYRIPVPAAVPVDDKWEYFMPTGDEIWHADWQSLCVADFQSHPRDHGRRVGDCYVNLGAWQFRRPKPTKPQPQPEMTLAIWYSMAVEQRREWNRPAYDADGVLPIEYMNGNWYDNGDCGISLEFPHRIKPATPPLMRYWLIHGPESQPRLEFSADEPSNPKEIAVELVGKGSVE